MSETHQGIESVSEKILSIVTRVSRKKGMLGLAVKTYTVVVTDQRLIFAQVNKAVLAKQKEDLEQLRKKNKAEGKGFLASWGESISTGLSWYNRYLEMDPDTILAESEENFFLKKSDIIALKTEEYPGLNHADSKTPLPYFTIKTRDQKFKFLLQKGADVGQLKVLKEWGRSS